MGKGKGIMLQGTASDVGKTVLCTALCRLFMQDGFRVAPFKAQNMTLNSYVTADGGEMGTAQALQALAAGVEPRVEMNPILLKPTGDLEAQVVVLGKPLADMTARGYRRDYLPQARRVVQECLQELQAGYELLVAEGAGSCAEVNLRDGDIVNMFVAETADLPVVLVADIDRGGVFASIIGTLELLTPAERERVVGIIVNKFRGDRELFRSGVEFLEEKTGKPVLGVIPYLEHGIAEEDSASLSRHRARPGEVEIAVLKLPRIANFTDVQVLSLVPGVSLRYVKGGEAIGPASAVIIPDTTNPAADLGYLRAQGYAEELAALRGQGVPVLGLGAGCYLLGETLQAGAGTVHPGLGWLPMAAVLEGPREGVRVEGLVTGTRGKSWQGLEGAPVQGYELRGGRLSWTGPVQTWVAVNGQEMLFGSEDGLVLGTQLHGVFHNRELLLAFVNKLRQTKGLPPLTQADCRGLDLEAAFDRLAAGVRPHLNLPLLYQLMGIPSRDQAC